MSDQIKARIRTAWPMVLGYLAAWLLVHGAPVVAWLHDTLGITVTAPQVAAALAIVLGYAIYEAGRWLELRTGEQWPARLGRGLGRALLSLGLPTGQPVYDLPPAETQSEAEYDPDGNLRLMRSVTTWPPRG